VGENGPDNRYLFIDDRCQLYRNILFTQHIAKAVKSFVSKNNLY